MYIQCRVFICDFPPRAGLGSMTYEKGKWITTCKKGCVVPVKTNSAFGNVRGK